MVQIAGACAKNTIARWSACASCTQGCITKPGALSPIVSYLLVRFLPGARRSSQHHNTPAGQNEMTAAVVETNLYTQVSAVWTQVKMGRTVTQMIACNTGGRNYKEGYMHQLRQMGTVLANLGPDGWDLFHNHYLALGGKLLYNKATKDLCATYPTEGLAALTYIVTHAEDEDPPLGCLHKVRTMKGKDEYMKLSYYRRLAQKWFVERSADAADDPRFTTLMKGMADDWLAQDLLMKAGGEFKKQVPKLTASSHIVHWWDAEDATPPHGLGPDDGRDYGEGDDDLDDEDEGDDDLDDADDDNDAGQGKTAEEDDSKSGSGGGSNPRSASDSNQDKQVLYAARAV
jgi:hypothetical protein